MAPEAPRAAAGFAPAPGQRYRARSHRAEYVQTGEAQRPQRTLDQEAERGKEDHVADQVHGIAMQEGGREHAPQIDLAAAHQVAQGEHVPLHLVVAVPQRFPGLELCGRLEQFAAPQTFDESDIGQGALRHEFATPGFG
jgi:hypothetical protein